MGKHFRPRLAASVVLDADQHADLAREAERASTSVSTVVRAIIRNWQLRAQPAVPGQEACREQ
jgi:hypothetical protein